MNSLGKKAGYLKGLMEGLSFSDPAQEKVMQAIADLLGELCDRVEAVDDLLDDLNDYMESIDDDLAELEGDRDGDFRLLDDEEDFEDEDYLDTSDRLHLIGGKGEEEPDGDGEDDDEDEADTIAGVVCPDCQQPFFVDLYDPEGSAYVCPHCGRKVVPNPLTPDNAPIAKPVDEE